MDQGILAAFKMDPNLMLSLLRLTKQVSIYVNNALGIKSVLCLQCEITDFWFLQVILFQERYVV